MNPNKDKYFNKEYLELVFKAMDYIEKNIDSIGTIGDEEFNTIDDRFFIAIMIAKYKKDDFDEGLGLQILATASIIKTIIEDKKIKSLKTGKVFEFENKNNKFFLKT